MRLGSILAENSMLQYPDVRILSIADSMTFTAPFVGCDWLINNVTKPVIINTAAALPDHKINHCKECFFFGGVNLMEIFGA